MAVKEKGSGGEWDFKGDEAQQAPDDVKACLSKHEAITFRPKTEDANSFVNNEQHVHIRHRHEHLAMRRQLLKKLREISGLTTAALSESPRTDP